MPVYPVIYVSKWLPKNKKKNLLFNTSILNSLVIRNTLFHLSGCCFCCCLGVYDCRGVTPTEMSSCNREAETVLPVYCVFDLVCRNNMFSAFSGSYR